MSLEAEQFVLGAVLQDDSLVDGVQLDAMAFEAQEHRIIWQAILTLRGEGTAVDVLAVAAQLRRSGNDMAAYLTELLEITPTTAYAKAHAEAVRSAAVVRMTHRFAVELSEITADTPVRPLIEQLEAGVRGIRRMASGEHAASKPRLVALADAKGECEPPPVLWRDAGGEFAQAVLSIGEVALLSGEGGLGKSFLTLALAAAATSAHDLGSEHGAACGIRVMPGPAVFVSYEDSPARLYGRLCRMGKAALAPLMHVARHPEPLWAAGAYVGTSGPTPWWDMLWGYVRNVQARLVVIDPASSALADAAVGETGPVRRFLRALTVEAERAGCGILIVAHSTKAARVASRAGDDPGAGIVAGSAAWYDAARGILALSEHPDNAGLRLLECVKANYGRRGWGTILREATAEDGAFAGFEFGATPSNRIDNVRGWIKTQKGKSGHNGNRPGTTTEFAPVSQDGENPYAPR